MYSTFLLYNLAFWYWCQRYRLRLVIKVASPGDSAWRHKFCSTITTLSCPSTLISTPRPLLYKIAHITLWKAIYRRNICSSSTCRDNITSPSQSLWLYTKQTNTNSEDQKRVISSQLIFATFCFCLKFDLLRNKHLSNGYIFLQPNLYLYH